MIDEFDVGSLVRIDGYGYTIENMMHGGMGLVLLCRSLKDNHSLLYQTKIATKVFSPDQNMLQIRSELKIWQSLNHEHIATLKAVGHVNDWLCASMGWYPNGAVSHHSIKAAGGRIALKRMLLHICEALQYANSKNILHLDIKPSNILSLEDEYYLADWGISKLSASKAIKKDPSSGGTIPYVSPERFINEPANPSADIYSLGMTAYELLTNTLPFSEANVDDMVSSIVLGVIDKRLHENTKQMQSSWRNFILQCCAYDSSIRPATYKQVVKLIDLLEV